jgi:outer membrane protein W
VDTSRTTGVERLKSAAWHHFCSISLQNVDFRGDATMPRVLARTSVLTLLSLALAVPASAQIVQGLHFGGGVFWPLPAGSRTSGDVLNEDLNTLTFNIGDLTSGQLFGEYLLEFGDHIEVAAGVGFSSGTANSFYTDLTHPDGTDITQQLHLRIVPITGLVRFLPFGKPSHVQPYVGAGVSAMNFHYRESGEWVDYSDFSTFVNTYTGSGTAVGAVVVAGVRVPLRGDIWGLTFEWRYQHGTGDLTNQGFLADKIDLGGNNLNFGLLVRF